MGLPFRTFVSFFTDWNIHYAALLEYYKEHGTCNILTKQKYECTLVGITEDGKDYHYVGSLGPWLAKVRNAKKKNT